MPDPLAKSFYQRFREANQRNLAVNDRVNRVWSLFTPAVTFLTELGLLVVWGCGIWLVSNKQITVGVLALCGALTYGELAARFPRDGGVYAYLLETCGRRVAFLYGWMCMAVMDPGLCAAARGRSGRYCRRRCTGTMRTTVSRSAGGRIAGRSRWRLP